MQNIAAWQGGDIVIFKKHIGIVSNLRNANGVPYLIHHANPFQAAYEEDVLERCLKSAAELVDEIIIVDTGSTDRTKEIAARFTGKIFDFPWRDDFAAARNESFSHAIDGLLPVAGRRRCTFRGGPGENFEP